MRQYAYSTVGCREVVDALVGCHAAMLPSKIED